MKFKGYYILSEINCGWLTSNGVFYPCDYQQHTTLLNYLIDNNLIFDKNNLIKFNSIGNFKWLDFSNPLKSLTDEQRYFIENNINALDIGIISDLKY